MFYMQKISYGMCEWIIGCRHFYGQPGERTFPPGHVCICMCMYVYVCVYAYMYMYVCIIYWGELSGGNVLPKTGGELSWVIVREIVRGGIVQGEIVLHPGSRQPRMTSVYRDLNRPEWI